jgi:hypothetical protein
LNSNASASASCLSVSIWLLPLLIFCRCLAPKLLSQTIVLISKVKNGPHATCSLCCYNSNHSLVNACPHCPKNRTQYHAWWLKKLHIGLSSILNTETQINPSS